MFHSSVIARSVRILSATDRRKVFAVIIFQVFFGLLDLAGIALVGVMGALAVTGVQSKEPGNRVSMILNFLRIEEYSLQSQATVIGLLAAMLLIAKTLFSVIFVRKTIFFLSRRSAGISANLISRVLSQPLIRVQARSMQDTLYAVTSGVESIMVGVLSTVVLMISDLSLLIILAVGLFIVDPIMAFTTFVVFVLIALFLYRLLEVRAVRLGLQQRNVTIESSEKILEVLNSYREIVVRNRRGYYARELGKMRYELADLSAERTFMPNISKYVIEITVVLGSLGIAALEFAINDAAHAIAVLSVFMAASTRISPAILRLQQGAIAIKSNVGSASPTLDLIEELDSRTADRTIVDALDFEHLGFTGEIRLENVNLTYPTKETPAVRNISLNIKPGQVVSFVGPSGAGKTTIIDLVLGVLEPDSGRVQIQDRPPLETIRLWPGAIGYVPQDVMISNGTIRQNVCLGYSPEEVKDHAVWAALEIAQLANFVKELPNGLETQVGDRGAKLSGGQRQRLGIARAMFTKPKLLVLDEATSALDGATEASISEAVHLLKGGVTIVMIAHRLSTVRESDVIFYMRDGRIDMSGTFEEIRKAIPEFAIQAKLMGM
jgi:ABC-type bacteriocin/lantibiotic exporter with double-glycine peptidase domain